MPFLLIKSLIENAFILYFAVNKAPAPFAKKRNIKKGFFKSGHD